MLQKVRTLVGRGPLSLLLAALLTLGSFALGCRSATAGAGNLTRPLALAAVLFPLLFVAFRLFAGRVKQELDQERKRLEEEPPRGPWLWLFVLYKEAVKTIFGVSLTLGWMAGLLFIAEHCGDKFIFLPVFLGLALSVAAFLPAFFFSSLLDGIRYPQGD